MCGRFGAEATPPARLRGAAPGRRHATDKLREPDLEEAKVAEGLRLVGEVLAEPALHLAGGDSFSARVVRDLVAADSSDGEVARLRMAKVDAADARAGR